VFVKNVRKLQTAGEGDFLTHTVYAMSCEKFCLAFSLGFTEYFCSN